MNRRGPAAVVGLGLVVLAVVAGLIHTAGWSASGVTAGADRAGDNRSVADHTAASRVPPAGGGVASGPGNRPGPVPAHPAQAIGALLNRRAAALRAGDRAGWLAGLDPSSDPTATRFRTQQGQVFDRVHTLRPATWTYRVRSGSALPAGDGATTGEVAWLAQVQLEYQLLPGGPQVHRDQFLTIVRRGGQWRIRTDTDGATGTDIWDLGPIAQTRSSRCLVIGAWARRAQITQLAGECGRSARTVDTAWGRDWNRRTVLIVPNTLHQLAVLLGRSAPGTPAATSPDSQAGLSRTAAVTIGPADAAADEVLINGQAFGQLRAIGRRVVLTHELVHVATRATGARWAPTWLEEGFADYVAYAGTGLSPDQVAGDALTAVRAGRIPAHLPATDDFNAAGNQAASAYGQAWIAAQLIARKAGGRPRMRAFYQQAAAGPGPGSPAALNAAFARLGLHDTAAFVVRWQARLRRLAG